MQKLLGTLLKGDFLYRDKKFLIEKPLLMPSNIGYSVEALKDLLLRGAHAEDNNKLLLDNNWLYTKATAEDRALLCIKGKGRPPYVFKYIGEFLDESPSVDINGLEF